MKTSRVLREVWAGRQALSLKINITHPDVVELAGLAGASAVWLCQEHVPADWSALGHCVRAARIHDMDTIVRISKGAYSDYVKPFEADAAGVMVPHVASGAEARQIVEMCKFHPVGKRALDGGNVDGAFCQLPMAEYLKASNQEKYLILQIESPEGIEAIDEIAAVPGYEFLLFGPGDFAHRIGQAGNLDHAEVRTARTRVEDAARKYGKQLFAVAAGGTRSEQLARGYAIANVGSDVWGLGETFRRAIAGNQIDAAPSIYEQP